MTGHGVVAIAMMLAVAFPGYAAAGGVGSAVTGAAEKAVAKKLVTAGAERAAVKAGATAAAAKLPNHVVRTFHGGKYTTFQLGESGRFYHYHPEKQYLPTANEYSYLTNTQYRNSKEAVDRLALAAGDRAKYVTEFVVPKGTVIHGGTVGAANGRTGGGMQYVIKDISPNWAVSTRQVLP